jgi:uncharacterized protein
MADPESFPLPDTETGPLVPLWQAAARGEFALPRCQDCGAFAWYPHPACSHCGGSDIAWTPLSGRATLFSWAVVNRALHKPLAPLVPYISAMVVIDEDRQTRFVTRLVDCDASDLRAGMPVAVRFADLGYPAVTTGVIAPLFTPISLNEGNAE